MPHDTPPDNQLRGAHGTWFTLALVPDLNIARDQRLIVVMSCPECGELANIRHPLDEHPNCIDADGIVAQPVRCPMAGCQFAARVQLEDWREHRP